MSVTVTMTMTTTTTTMMMIDEAQLIQCRKHLLLTIQNGVRVYITAS